MVRLQLGQVPKELDPSQRQNIFHGGCLINDKICLFIIDSGSCVNMASPRVVDKLGLKTIPHAKPYKLSWLKEEDNKITKQVPINFSIGNFRDKVLYDRKVFYDGHTNTYAFSFQGKKFTLLPIHPPQENEDQNKIKDEKKKRKRASFHQRVTCLQKEFFKARGATPFFLLFPNQER